MVLNSFGSGEPDVHTMPVAIWFANCSRIRQTLFRSGPTYATTYSVFKVCMGILTWNYGRWWFTFPKRNVQDTYWNERIIEKRQFIYFVQKILYVYDTSCIQSNSYWSINRFQIIFFFASIYQIILFSCW